MKRTKARKAKPAPAKRAAKKTSKAKPRIASRSAHLPKKSKKAATKARKPIPADALDALMTATAQELKLPLDPAWRPGVKFNLRLDFAHRFAGRRVSAARRSRAGTRLPRLECPMLDTPTNEFAAPSAADIAESVASGQRSAQSVIEAALARIRERDPVLNAFTAVTEDRALLRARAIDDTRARGEPVGPLAGVPFAVKNLFDIAGLPTLAGSKINRDLPPAARDATLIERLEAAGAILVGALNMGEYAYDFTGENIHDGPSRNPHDINRMSGGSSGGSGSAVGGGTGADRARLRHQRFDPGAVLALRHLRPQADLRPAVARPHISLRVELRSFGAVRAHRATIWRCPTMQCRASTPTIRSAPSGRPSRSPRCWIAARMVCASPLPRAISNAKAARPATPSTASRRRSAPIATSKSRRPIVRAPRPSSSPRPKARACISTGCGRARPITIPRCATGSSPARWRRLRWSSRRRNSAAGIATRCSSCSTRSTSFWRRRRPAPRR